MKKYLNNLVVFFLWVFLASSSGFTDEVSPLDLMPGDMIFWTNTLGGADHVAIYAGIGEDRRPYVLHAVSDSKYNSIAKTVLKKMEGLTYSVFRNNNLALSLSAYHRINTWSKRKVPYDRKSAAFVMRVEDSEVFKGSLSERLEAHYQYAVSQSIPRFYRRIKYAARGEMSNLPRSEAIKSSGRGLRCAEAAILAYQVEELIHLNLIRLVPKNSVFESVWVSDKYAHEESLDRCGASLGYRAYQKQLSSVEEYRVAQPEKVVIFNHLKFLPSIELWNFELEPSIEGFAQRFDTVFPIDSKISTASVMLTHVRRDSRHWTYLGPLKLQEFTFSEAEKEAWRVHRDLIFQEANIAQSLVAQRAIESSPELSGFESNSFVSNLQRPMSPLQLDEKKSQDRIDVKATPPRPQRTRRTSSSHSEMGEEF